MIPTRESNIIDDSLLSDQRPIKGCFLTDLPAELRIRIMEYLLLDQPTLLATIHHYHQESAARMLTRTVLPSSGTCHPLHLTCKSLHQEFSKIQLEQATHVFHQPPARDGGIQDAEWFKDTATHPIRHIKVIVEYRDEGLGIEDVVERINDAFSLLQPAYRNIFPEAHDIDFVHVFRDVVNKATTGVAPYPDHQYPFSTSSRFDFWTKTERVPSDALAQAGTAIGTGIGIGGGGSVGVGGVGNGNGSTTANTALNEEGILSINNLHHLPLLFPQMVRFDVDWTVTHTSALGRLRFQARNKARVISEAMKAFVGVESGEVGKVGGRRERGGGEVKGKGEKKRATLQLRSINSDYGGTTQDLDFDTDRSM